MTHEPDVADAFVGTGTQLVLAGHKPWRTNLDSFLSNHKCFSRKVYQRIVSVGPRNATIC